MKPVVKILPKVRMEVLYGGRCQHKTGGGLHGMDYCNGNKIPRCTRVPRFEFDGIKVCKQHAGALSLHYVMHEECKK